METVIKLRVDRANKEIANEVFARLGLSMRAGINAFLAQVALRQGIPFPLRLIEQPKRITDDLECEVRPISAQDLEREGRIGQMVRAMARGEMP